MIKKKETRDHIRSNIELYDWQEDLKTYKGDVAIRGGRQTGKSLSVARRIVHLAYAYPESRIFIGAASERQENYLYERVKELIPSGDFKGRSTLSYTKLKNGTEIYKFPLGQTGKYLEGLPSIDFMFIDEAIHVNEKVWDSIIPMLAEPKKRGFGWLTLLSSTRAKPKGFFYNACNNKKYKQFHIRAEDCNHISKEFLKEEKLRLGETLYNVIYNGEFDESAQAFFPPEFIDRAKRNEIFKINDVSRLKEYYLGIDPAKFGRSKAGFAISEINGEKIKLIWGEEIKKSSFKEMREKTLKLHLLFIFKKIFYDSGGLGQGFDEYLEEEKLLKRKLRALNNAQAGKFGKILKEDLYSNVLKLIESEELEIIDDKIIESLKKVEWDEINERIIGNDLSEASVRACWAKKEKSLKIKIYKF